MNILTITANKTIAPTVKAILAIEAELAKVQKELAANVDETKVEKLNSQIQELQGKLAHQGLRRATQEERSSALKGITNQDTRRALAPTYLNANACWVEVKKTGEPVAGNQVEKADAPAKKAGKKTKSKTVVG